MGFRERRGNCSTHLVTAPLPWGPSRVLQGVPVQTPSQQALVWVWALNKPYLVSCCLRRQFLHSKPGSWSSSQRALWGPKSGGRSTIAREGGELFWFVPYKYWRHHLIPDCPITPIMTCNGAFAQRPKGCPATAPCCFLLTEQHVLKGKQWKPGCGGGICSDFKLSELLTAPEDLPWRFLLLFLSFLVLSFLKRRNHVIELPPRCWSQPIKCHRVLGRGKLSYIGHITFKVPKALIKIIR